MKKTGSSYYDKPSGPEKGTVWDAHLAAEASKSSSSQPSSPPDDGKMSVQSLNKKVEDAMKQASMGEGQVDYNTFVELLRRNT